MAEYKTSISELFLFLLSTYIGLQMYTESLLIGIAMAVISLESLLGVIRHGLDSPAGEIYSWHAHFTELGGYFPPCLISAAYAFSYSYSATILYIVLPILVMSFRDQLSPNVYNSIVFLLDIFCFGGLIYFTLLGYNFLALVGSFLLMGAIMSSKEGSLVLGLRRVIWCNLMLASALILLTIRLNYQSL